MTELLIERVTLGPNTLLWAHSRETALSSVAVNDPC